MELPTKPLGFLLAMSKPYTFWMVMAILASTLAQILSSSVAYAVRGIVDSATRYADGLESYTVLVLWVAAYPVLITVSELLWRASGFTGMLWATGLKKTAYGTLFEYMSHHSSAYFSKKFAGSLGSSINNAMTGLGSLVESFLWNYLPTMVAALATIVLAATTNLILGFVFLFWIALIIPINIWYSQRIAKYSEENSANWSKLRGFTVDIISNMVAVHSFARRAHETKNIEAASAEQRQYSLRSWRTSEVLLLINSIFLALFTASVLVVAFMFWQNGTITLGEFIMALTLTGNVAWVILFIGSALNNFATNFGEVKNGLGDVLVPHEIMNANGAQTLAEAKGDIAFTDVKFSYGDKVVFDDFSLDIKAGQRVGIVGPSGSGKTTLVSLLLRYHDVVGGVISIDGWDIRQITLESLRESIAMVPQDPYLFHRSIKDNIRYGHLEATDEEVMEAARKAQAHDFITVLPQGYDTIVGERGVKLSGGQRQRIAIARAILKAAPVLILDEATSSLDSESESEIQRALQELMKGKTVLAIAHRLSTIRAMDRIIVLEGGKVVEDGTHNELLTTHGTYSRLWTHQAGGFLKEEGGNDAKNKRDESREVHEE